jgi:7-carboxy-7-deazaguanine synthase
MGEQMTLEKIVAQVKQFNCPRLTITGGEPLIQQETPVLVAQMIEEGFAASIETNGSINIGPIDQRCMKVVDLKCPSSGMQDQNCMDNVALLGPKDQLKFVIANKNDFEFAVSISNRLATDIDAERILFSPVHGVLPAAQLSAWMLEAVAHARLQLQLHKILWPHKEAGV